MAELGMRAYRFSLAWARIIPQGRGAINKAGLDFYDRLVDSLLTAHITPFITLYHWDLPQALQEKGGWLNRDTALSFQDYADVVTKRLGDRVQNWITLNEPFISADHGHVTGEHAPGLHDLKNYFPVTHHLLLAHGLAVQPIRANVAASRVGLAYSLAEIQPATDRSEDVEIMPVADAYMNGAYLDATLRGTYPAALERYMASDVVQSEDLATISAPTDFIGINYYMRLLVKATPRSALPGFEIVPWPTGPRTEMGWEMYPDGLTYWVRRISHDFPDHDIYITENGAAFPDVVGDDHTIHDRQRIDYLRDHTRAALSEMHNGARLKGYFVWTFTDNFEWAYGFRPRFGLVHVDFATQERIIKESGRWYARLIESGAPDDA